MDAPYFSPFELVIFLQLLLPNFIPLPIRPLFVSVFPLHRDIEESLLVNTRTARSGLGRAFLGPRKLIGAFRLLCYEVATWGRKENRPIGLATYRK